MTFWIWLWTTGAVIVGRLIVSIVIMLAAGGAAGIALALIDRRDAHARQAHERRQQLLLDIELRRLLENHGAEDV